MQAVLAKLGFAVSQFFTVLLLLAWSPVQVEMEGLVKI
jgi:hypothetical protein